jgi:Family of unknown function (DUF6152)
MNATTALRRFLAACALILMAAVPVGAHHSGAMFDGQQTITLQGTVKEFRWGNPHSWIQLMVPKDGVDAEWSIEMGSTTQLYRSGWRPGTLKNGDKISVVVHPLRDGTAGAQYLSAQGPGGATLGKAKSGSAP